MHMIDQFQRQLGMETANYYSWQIGKSVPNSIFPSTFITICSPNPNAVGPILDKIETLSNQDVNLRIRFFVIP